MLGQLLRALLQGLKALVEFVAIVVVGLLVVLVWVLPWAIRAASILAWLGGTYLAGETLNQVYGPMSEPMAMVALWSIPAVLAASVPVFVHQSGKMSRIWGAMFLFGLLCWEFERLTTHLFETWPYADLFYRAAPALMAIVFVVFMAPRLRMLRSIDQAPTQTEGEIAEKEVMAEVA